MLKISKKISKISLVGVLLLAFVLNLSAQETTKKAIVSPESEHINLWSNAFSINCSAFLMEANAWKNVENAVKAMSQEEKKEQQLEPVSKGPVDPRRLFVIPTAEVLNSLEVNFGGGSSFGVRKTEERPFLGHMRLGLGGVAEVEVSTLGIINQLSGGSATIPSAAFKLRFFPEGKLRPGFAGALVSSLWNSEERGMVKFERRLSTLYFVATKTFKQVSVHAGISINDLRIRTRTLNDDYVSPTSAQAAASDKDYFNRNLVGPFVGVRVELNPKTKLMMELEQVAEYKFDEANPILTKDDISARWMGIAGVRFFFFDWLALDTGVMYRSDYHGIGDAQISAGLNICLSLPRIIRSLWKE
jgi:hypothetical protein